MTHPHENATAQPPERGNEINTASAWILRIGVLVSSVVMLIGLAVTYFHGTLSLTRIDDEKFNPNPMTILHGIAAGHGKSIIEAGVYLLVLTPIMRVLMSVILFATAQRDWLYTVITFCVLAMTLAGLLWL